ncbi:MAG: DUF2974 domain-containing protein [Bacilli bacterium]|nr:DUF2974 domain-containing protein [Bacilli bacterium]
MSIYNYIDNYGMKTFEEMELKRVDAVLFSFLSYANFDGILENGPLTIKEAGRIHLSSFKGKDNNIIAIREANKLLRYIKDTNRYKNCILSNYKYIANNDIQFGVIAIEFKKNHVFISFEGTDEMFSGWKENFMLTLQFPTISHKAAIRYVNDLYTFSNKTLYLGGHSKGGNFALVAGMYCNGLIRRKVKHIYNIDGPGVLDAEFNSKQYQDIRNKYTHIISDYSIVGLFFNHDNDIIVKSDNKGPLAHDIVNWPVEKDHFIPSELSKLSLDIEKGFKDILEKYSDEERLDFINNLDLLFARANVKTILDLKSDYKKIIKLIYESRDIDETTKNLTIDCIKMLVKSFSTVKKEEIQRFLSEKVDKVKSIKSAS